MSIASVNGKWMKNRKGNFIPIVGVIYPEPQARSNGSRQKIDDDMYWFNKLDDEKRRAIVENCLSKIKRHVVLFFDGHYIREKEVILPLNTEGYFNDSRTLKL